MAEAAEPLGDRGLAALLSRADIVADGISSGGEGNDVFVDAEAGLIVGDGARRDDGGDAVGVGVVECLAGDGTCGQLVAIGKGHDGGNGALIS